uniref:F-box domain-containing protein n=1 Tax=Strigamia maritima TaxID=126957 RepID=T1J956_STRMM
MAASCGRNLLEHPGEILEKIISFCNFDEITRLRLVCKTFDRHCKALLNKGFISVDRYHAQCLRQVKSQLPRRESERRNHPLARHCDILTAIETRLSLLGMTFLKYVDTNLCCFIPGKVIDEIYRVLRYIQQTPSPPRAHEILQELRDISSMAMEHFDEKIVPIIKQKMIHGNVPTRLSIPTPGHFSLSGPSTLVNSPRTFPLPRTIRQDLFKLQQSTKQTNSSLLNLKKEVLEQKAKITEHKKKISDSEKQILEQTRIISEQNAKMTEQESKLNEMNRKILEYDQKFSDLMAELIRCREEVHGHDNKSRTQSNAPVIVERDDALKNQDKSVVKSDFQSTLKTRSSRTAAQKRQIAETMEASAPEYLYRHKFVLICGTNV